jgi:hypothetical protein
LGKERLHPGVDEVDEPPHDVDGDGDRTDDDEACQEITAQPSADMRGGGLPCSRQQDELVLGCGYFAALLGSRRRLVLGFHVALRLIADATALKG